MVAPQEQFLELGGVACLVIDIESSNCRRQVRRLVIERFVCAMNLVIAWSWMDRLDKSFDELAGIPQRQVSPFDSSIT